MPPNVTENPLFKSGRLSIIQEMALHRMGQKIPKRMRSLSSRRAGGWRVQGPNAMEYPDKQGRAHELTGGTGNQTATVSRRPPGGTLRAGPLVRHALARSAREPCRSNWKATPRNRLPAFDDAQDKISANNDIDKGELSPAYQSRLFASDFRQDRSPIRPKRRGGLQVTTITSHESSSFSRRGDSAPGHISGVMISRDGNAGSWFTATAFTTYL